MAGKFFLFGIAALTYASPVMAADAALEMQQAVSKGCVPYIAAGMPEAALVAQQKLVPVEEEHRQSFLRGRAGSAYILSQSEHKLAMILTEQGSACSVMVRKTDKGAAEAALQTLLKSSRPAFTVSEPMRSQNGVETTGYQTVIKGNKIGVVGSFSSREDAPYQAMVTVFAKQ